MSCKNEKLVDEEYLTGKWVIYDASRNNKKTNTLDGAFFFFNHNIVTTNFQGVENQAEFTLQDNELHLTKGLNYTFHLYKSPNTELIMTTRIQNTNFEFKLRRE